MRAGILTELITVLSPNIIVNEVGEQTTEYLPKLTTRANVNWKTGNRNIENNEIVFDYTKDFKVRYYVDINEFDRILWNNKQYRIISIEPNKHYQELNIIAEQIND